MRELFKVKFNGHTYAGYGYIKCTKNATTEIVEIDEDGVDTISVGKDKWYNRPWYKFQFANALEDAVIKWFGKQASEKIYRAVNDSSNCQQAMDKFISSLNVRESYKRRIREGSSYAVGDKMFKLNGINLKDWYTSEYPDDELGYELNDDVDLRKCYSSLGREPDIYDVMGVGDSLIRERVFAKIADVMGVDYDVIYRKWLDY